MFLLLRAPVNNSNANFPGAVDQPNPNSTDKPMAVTHDRYVRFVDPRRHLVEGLAKRWGIEGVVGKRFLNPATALQDKQFSRIRLNGNANGQRIQRYSHTATGADRLDDGCIARFICLRTPLALARREPSATAAHRGTSRMQSIPTPTHSDRGVCERPVPAST